MADWHKKSGFHVHSSGREKQLPPKETCLEMTLVTWTFLTATQMPSLTPHAFFQQVLIEPLLCAQVPPNQETESHGKKVTGPRPDPVNGKPQTQLE